MPARSTLGSKMVSNQVDQGSADLESCQPEEVADGFRFDEGSILARLQDGTPSEYAPVLWNIELTEKLRNNLAYKEVPIIMATTESDSSQLDLAMKTGVNDFISKPFTQDDILEKITGLLP